MNWPQHSTDLRVSSLQFGLSLRSHSSFTSESCRLFPLSSSSLRWEGLDFRAEAREAQLISDKLQRLNLNKEEMMEIKIHLESNQMCSGLKCGDQHYYVLINELLPEMSRVTLSLCYCGSSSCQPSTHIIQMSAQHSHTCSCQHTLITCCWSQTSLESDEKKDFHPLNSSIWAMIWLLCDCVCVTVCVLQKDQDQ